MSEQQKLTENWKLILLLFSSIEDELALKLVDSLRTELNLDLKLFINAEKQNYIYLAMLETRLVKWRMETYIQCYSVMLRAMKLARYKLWKLMLFNNAEDEAMDTKINED